LKTTSLISVVPYYELLYATRAIYANTYQVIPMLIMASLWYAAMSSVLMVGQFYIERHYSRGFAHAGGNAVRRRWRSR
ncbi:MAG: amino acid ABC transporter permease, partial [Actinomycetes bacterium]